MQIIDDDDDDGDDDDHDDDDDDDDNDGYDDNDNDNLRLAGVHVFEEEEPNWFPSAELREDQDIGIHKVITLKHDSEIMLNDENLLNALNRDRKGNSFRSKKF